jgi:uncharacterized protein YggE
MKALAALAAAALLAVSAPAAAQTQGPTVAEFLQRAQMLMLGGAGARETPEFQALLADVAAAGKDVRARQEAERAAGGPVTFCLPEQGKAENDLIAHLLKIPEAQRNRPFRDAFADYVRAKYPCPAR